MIPLLSGNNLIFSSCLTLRTGQWIAAKGLADFMVSLSCETTLAGRVYLSSSILEFISIFYDDSEFYPADVSTTKVDWSVLSYANSNELLAEKDFLGERQAKASLTIESQTPISGLHSGMVLIPANATLTLSKLISWPERLPFAVSAKPFAIVQPNETEANDEQDPRVIPEKDYQDKILDEGSADLEPRGPHSGMPAAVPPVRATLYSTAYYIYSFDGKLLAEYDATGTCQKDYIYMGNKLLAEYQPVTGAKYYYTTDQINSTRIITDSSGAVVYSALFDPFGGMQKQWVNTYQPSLKFSGKEREARSELDYFGARYYDHLKYRFLSVDPVINKDEALTNPQLWNLYAYCGNNPVTYCDPDGRKIDYKWFASMAELNLIKSYLGQDPVARAMIQEAEAMDETITLVESPMQHVHKNGTIWFDPYAGNKLDSGEIQSPALIFLHELGHAIKRLKDPAGHEKELDFDKKYDTIGERRVITEIETPVAKKLGEPTRKSHQGTSVRVPDPTFHKKINPIMEK